MPWKSSGQGQFEFSGPVLNWVLDFQKWYKEDAKNNTSVSFENYLLILVIQYAGFAKGKWQREWLGKKKVEKLDSFVTVDTQGNTNLRVFNVLDFLAENLNDKIRQEWSARCRSEAKSLLNLP